MQTDAERLFDRADPITMFEMVNDTMQNMIRIKMAAIYAEEAKATPDAAKIAELDAEVTAILKEKRAVSFRDEASMRRAESKYAPLLREHYARERQEREQAALRVAAA